MRYQLSQVFFILLITTNAIATAEPTQTASTSTQQSTEEQDKQNEKLIKDLKSGSFQDREAAMKKIIAVGPAIADKVRSMASKDANKDFNFRCESILKQIAENQHTQQIKDFISGKGELPAQHAASWARFQQLVGEPSSENRKYFGAMLQQTQAKELFGLYESTPGKCNVCIKNIHLERKSRKKKDGIVVGTEIQMAVAFVFSDQKKELENIRFDIVSSLLRNPNNKSNEVLCKLISELVAFEREESLDELDDSMVYLRFQLASVYQLKEAGELAIRVAQADDERISSFSRGDAIAYLGNVTNDPKDLPAIEKLITDDTELRLRMKGKEPNIRLGDIALAVALKITKQDRAEYEFEDYSFRKKGNDTAINAYTGFKDDEGRAAARKKWLEFRKASEDAKEE